MLDFRQGFWTCTPPSALVRFSPRYGKKKKIMRPTTLVLPLAVLAGSVTARLTRPEGRGLQSREAPQDITPNRDSSAYRSVAYVTNWSIYGAKFLPEQIAVDSISHVQYAFADILANGTV